MKYQKLTKCIKLSDVTVPPVFSNSKPKSSKLNKIRNYYTEHGCVDKLITINYKNLLLDGYARYLVLKENNVDVVEAEVIKYLPKKGWGIIL